MRRFTASYSREKSSTYRIKQAGHPTSAFITKTSTVESKELTPIIEPTDSIILDIESWCKLASEQLEVLVNAFNENRVEELENILYDPIEQVLLKGFNNVYQVHKRVCDLPSQFRDIWKNARSRLDNLFQDRDLRFPYFNLSRIHCVFLILDHHPQIDNCALNAIFLHARPIENEAFTGNVSLCTIVVLISMYSIIL